MLNAGTYVYSLSGIYYKYLKHKTLKKHIKKGTALCLRHKDKNVFNIKFEKTNLLRYHEAKLNKLNNRSFTRIIVLPSLIVFVIPFLFPKQFEDDVGIESRLTHNHFILIVIILSCIVSFVFLGIDFVSNKELVH